jgi:hypothetical protein
MVNIGISDGVEDVYKIALTGSVLQDFGIRRIARSPACASTHSGGDSVRTALSMRPELTAPEQIQWVVMKSRSGDFAMTLAQNLPTKGCESLTIR